MLYQLGSRSLARRSTWPILHFSQGWTARKPRHSMMNTGIPMSIRWEQGCLNWRLSSEKGENDIWTYLIVFTCETIQWQCPWNILSLTRNTCHLWKQSDVICLCSCNAMYPYRCKVSFLHILVALVLCFDCDDSKMSLYNYVNPVFYRNCTKSHSLICLLAIAVYTGSQTTET